MGFNEQEKKTVAESIQSGVRTREESRKKWKVSDQTLDAWIRMYPLPEAPPAAPVEGDEEEENAWDDPVPELECEEACRLGNAEAVFFDEQELKAAPESGKVVFERLVEVLERVRKRGEVPKEVLESKAPGLKPNPVVPSLILMGRIPFFYWRDGPWLGDAKSRNIVMDIDQFNAVVKIRYHEALGDFALVC